MSKVPYNKTARYRQSLKKYTAKRRAWLDDKKNHPCEDCGHTFHPAAMQFHHVRGRKKFTVGNLTRSNKSLEAEMGKCVLLCANCHFVRHHSPPSEWELERLLTKWEKEARMRPPEYRAPKCWKCGKETPNGMYHIFFRGGRREAHLCKKCGGKYAV